MEPHHQNTQVCISPSPHMPKKDNFHLLSWRNLHSNGFIWNCCDIRVEYILFWCKSYRAVLENPTPDLGSEASLGITGHTRINYGGVDKSRKVGTNCGQVTTVCKPCRGKIKVFILFYHDQLVSTKVFQNKVNLEMFALTSIESTGDYLVLHGVAKELQWSSDKQINKLRQIKKIRMYIWAWKMLTVLDYSH